MAPWFRSYLDHVRRPSRRRIVGLRKKPASDVVSELSGPVVGGTRAESKAKASVSTGPAPAAVTVKPCGYTDVRLKQGSELSGPATQSSPRGPAAAASQSLVPTGTTSGPAPWQQAGYNYLDAHVAHALYPGQTFDCTVAPHLRYLLQRNHNGNSDAVHTRTTVTTSSNHTSNQ